MARQPQTLINNKQAFSALSFAPVVDVRHNGQQGFVSDYRTYLSNSAWAGRHIIPFLLEYPRGFDHLPDKEIYIGTLKALVETHAKSIDGLNGTITLSWFDNPVGHAGDTQEDFSRVERAKSTPTFTWVERQGRPIQLFLNSWVYNLIAHPDTQTPMINAYRAQDNMDNSQKYFDFLPDFYAMAVLFVRPDPFQRRVDEAWLCVNMAPKQTGDNLGKREMGGAFQGLDLSIEFTAMTMQSMGVNQFAQTLLDEMNYGGFNPQTRRSAIEYVHENIKAPTMTVMNTPNEARNEQVGYLGQIDGVATTNHYENSGLANNTASITGTRMQHNPTWILSEGTDKNSANTR